MNKTSVLIACVLCHAGFLSLNEAAAAAPDVIDVNRLSQALEALEAELPTGKLSYTYECKSSEYFGAYARGTELAKTGVASYYGTTTLDATVQCSLVYSGLDYQIEYNKEYGKWGAFDNKGEFVLNEKKRRSIPPVKLTKQGAMLASQSEGSDTVFVQKAADNAPGVPLIQSLLAGFLPVSAPDHRVNDILEFGGKPLSQLVKQASELSKVKLTPTTDGKLVAHLEVLMLPEEPQASAWLVGDVILDPSVDYLPSECTWTIRASNNDSGIRYITRFSDYRATATGRKIPWVTTIQFNIIPAFYFPKGHLDDPILRAKFPAGPTDMVPIMTHTFTITDAKVPADPEAVKFELRLLPGTKVVDRILGKEYIFNSNLLELQKHIKPQR